VHELRDAPEPTLEALVARMVPVDLVLVEGFKREAFPKIEIHRAELGKPLLAPDDPHILAIASDLPLAGVALPRFDLNDIDGIAGFIADHGRLARGSANA
jgi:molybdopterin-guanine dinucleotide biosynthesis protein B